MNLTLQKTPFYQYHIALGGKMVDFAGWEMPIQYSTITLEHQAVRTAVGVFDISHMGQLLVWGSDAEAFLQKLITNDLKKAAIGMSIYAHLLNDKGGVIDDIFIYRLEDQKFLVIVNASRKETDFAWFEEHKTGFNVTMIEPPFAAALAIQGPKAAEVMDMFSDSIRELPRFGIAEFDLGDVSALVARTGYTGEDGFELFAPAGHLMMVWQRLFATTTPIKVTPCGLGARDTLRTEVAYPLYGHELDEQHTPLEAGLSWVVSFNKGDFIGREALEKQKTQGLTKKLYGFKVTAGGVARPGAPIELNDYVVGTVASGTFSPTLSVAIGLAYLPTNIQTEGQSLVIRLGTRTLDAVTTKLPFYRQKPKEAS